MLAFNVPVTRLLLRLFESRFDPARAGGAAERGDAIAEEVRGLLDEVEILDHDRILRSYLGLILATQRTNYFRDTPSPVPQAAIGDTPYLVLKLDAAAVPELPDPRPRFEAFVYSPRLEAVHLRFAPVARGGLRWSDRREDFRTEILGLAKAQEVKNSVIVPSGAKGGFVCKHLPDQSDREAYQARRCWPSTVPCRDWASPITWPAVVPPPGVVGATATPLPGGGRGQGHCHLLRHGQRDLPGLRLLARRRVRLRRVRRLRPQEDGDHRARRLGVGEVPLRHARRGPADHGVHRGRDRRHVRGRVRQRHAAVRHILLVAAFDHRHIFLDPAPDAAASFAERQRLFALPRSSWADYDSALISAGGGVWPRSAKSIPVSPQASRVLGLGEAVHAMPPDQLISAILAAPVDLLWNGGIGTYVKASNQTHADAGDRANDAVRIDAASCAPRWSRRAATWASPRPRRIEYAMGGGLVNTDFIDNVGRRGHLDDEVNIKILLQAKVNRGELTPTARGELLHAMTDEVAALVLRQNYDQQPGAGRRGRTGGADAARALPVPAQTGTGTPDRRPTCCWDKEIAERRSAGRG